ncbi:MAG: DNA polymerase III subunit [Candidatus Doudnabacteria bacterium]|nr:DNA polymerase III subunit [Candidatus Doudnabacteria bacterium]
MDWHTFGHEKNKNLLEKQLAAGSLSHAYLFSGSKGLGKKTLALEFAKRILGTENLGNHPDFQILDAEGEIGIESAREFMDRLSLKPFVAKKKVAVIDGAENLNLHTGNALLKTLEEPSSSTVIILVASGRLLPTIVSRCQCLHFYCFNRPRLMEFAKSLGFDADREILDLSFGSPAELARLLKIPAYLQTRTDSMARFSALKSATPGQRLSAIGLLAESETAELRGRLAEWLKFQVLDLKSRPAGFLKARALMEALSALDMNKNKKLVLQTLIFKI